jgi:hypothetical protein
MADYDAQTTICPTPNELMNAHMKPRQRQASKTTIALVLFI